MSKIAERAAALVDRAAGSWLSRTGGGAAARQRELMILRRLALLSSAALVAAPFGLSFVTSPAIALPVGVTTVCAAFLFSAVGSIALSRQSTATAAAAAPVAEEFFMEAIAGLAFFMDPQGNVTTVGGRDKREYLAWMRDPIGKGFVDQIHVSDRILFLQALDQLRQGEEAATVDVRLERPSVSRDNRQFAYLRIDLTARQDSDGVLFSVIAQLRDVSLEQQLRQEAQNRAADARSANDAKSRFLAAVSHELRTPLNAILGFSDILLGEYFGKFENERQREYVGLVRDSGAHLLSVVNTMLDMSKIEAGRYELCLEPFDIASVVRSCEAMLALQAKTKGVSLTSRVQRGLDEVIADQRAIQQILINLVGNAVKFTDAGGAISIDASMRDGVLNLCVSDTGIGIPGDKLEMLGQPFVQIQNDYSRRFEGTGLGLSLVKGLVALHGGDFAIASTPGAGTIITISIAADGSGIPAAGTARNDLVEFPPRLKAAPTSVGVLEEGLFDGHEQAKIA
ncbi:MULTISPECIES: PAS domain-containing sensor histidine kinase [unclassified Rhizobium]|uniref:sensor histidine kinase n=1 Tax=unclassified Rhizobium TaxID=2613769 RepID=UPI00161611DA|nr:MULTISPECIES: PAS domain-containing sensor histidine kinase [unclassified Rhizobium]MBB3539781.1 cell cycle sensor histidine kinase DivJ [Rhizobium sp. BK399]MCS3739210.1 cell cycle sensor histidine kinase DivJ [Rhizobium sp. BK661]MCS4090465.1 cell cycle sensor histidine kinase DivJ [Rhizobium sp. BK176]